MLPAEEAQAQAALEKLLATGKVVRTTEVPAPVASTPGAKRYSLARIRNAP